MKPNLSIEHRHKINVRTLTMFIALFVIWLAFTFLTKGSFITVRNISNLSRQMSVVGILATSMVLVIVSGGIDLSVGSVLGFASCIGALMQVQGHLNTPVVIVLLLIIGATIGLGQGLIIVYSGIPPFIVTLGFQMIFRGAILGVTGGATIAPFTDSFKYIGQGYLSVGLGYTIAIAAVALIAFFKIRELIKQKNQNVSNRTGAASVLFYILGWAALLFIIVYIMNSYQGIPFSVLLMLIIMLIFTIVAEKTSFGRRIYAIGGNVNAAKYAGINVQKNITMVYMLNGLLACVAGIVLGARLNAGTPSNGLNLELDAIAAAVIGGTSMAGGSGKITGALLGALIMASIDNGMSMMNMEAFWQNIVKGSILIVSVGFDMYYANRKKI